jgi:hypothetical protein
MLRSCYLQKEQRRAVPIATHFELSQFERKRTWCVLTGQVGIIKRAEAGFPTAEIPRKSAVPTAVPFPGPRSPSRDSRSGRQTSPRTPHDRTDPRSLACRPPKPRHRRERPLIAAAAAAGPSAGPAAGGLRRPRAAPRRRVLRLCGRYPSGLPAVSAPCAAATGRRLGAPRCGGGARGCGGIGTIGAPGGGRDRGGAGGGGGSGAAAGRGACGVS